MLSSIPLRHKMQYEVRANRFESNVIFDTSQTDIRFKYFGCGFESNVIFDTSQTEKLDYWMGVLFESNVIFDTSQTFFVSYYVLIVV